MRQRPPYHRRMTMTPNQVIAFNLGRARRLRGMKQEDAAEALAPYLGTRWSVATFSAAERSVAGERIRQFTADEVVAFAQAFSLPIPWFFIPPHKGEGTTSISANPNPPSIPDGDVLLSSSDMIDLLFAKGLDDFTRRLGEERYSSVKGQMATDEERVSQYFLSLLQNIVSASPHYLGLWLDVVNGLRAALEPLRAEEVRRMTQAASRDREALVKGLTSSEDGEEEG